MNHTVNAPGEDVGPPDPSTGPSKPDVDALAPSDDAVEPEELDADAPATVYELMLARSAGHVVKRCARSIARKFPRLIRDSGLMSIEDLQQMGALALLRAARNYRAEENPEFPAYAHFYVRGAMLDALGDLLFEERVKHAAAKAEDNYLAQHRDTDYDVMKHDEVEARRRYRAFANGLLAATFAASVEAAQQGAGSAEIAVQREFDHALAILRKALPRLAGKDQELLALMYRDLMDLKAASKSLGIPYSTARARHARALVVLHELLVAQGVVRAPRPLVVPDVGDVLQARAPPAGNDTDPDEVR